MSLPTTNSDSTKLKTIIVISVLVAAAAAVGFGLFSKSSHKKKVASPPSLLQEDEKEKKAEKDAVKDYGKTSLSTHSKSVPAAPSKVANPSPKPDSSGSPARYAPSPRSASSPGKSYAKAASPAAVSMSSEDAQSAAFAIRSSSVPVVAGPLTTSSSSLKTDSFVFHPEFDEMSNFFYKNANGETCSVYSLLTTESDAYFETLFSKKFPYKYDDEDRDNQPLKESKQDHKEGKPNGNNHPSQPNYRSKHPKVSPKARDHENYGSELAESSPMNSTTFTKQDEEEEDEKTVVLNLLNKPESPSLKLPVMEPVELDQEAKDDAEKEILESLETVTESLSSSSSFLETKGNTPEYESLLAPIPPATSMNAESVGTEKSVSEEERLVNHSPIAVFDVSQVEPAAADSKQSNALNVQASEFVPSYSLPSYSVQSSFAYQDVQQYAGHASGYYDYQQGSMLAGEYNEMHPSWNPYAVAGQGMTILFFMASSSDNF